MKFMLMLKGENYEGSPALPAGNSLRPAQGLNQYWRIFSLKLADFGHVIIVAFLPVL